MPPTGLEPVTPRLGIWCSILMSYGGNFFNASDFYYRLIKVYKDCITLNLNSINFGVKS